MDTQWHSLPLDEVTRRLATSPSGLSSKDANAARLKAGPNVLPRPAQKSLLAVAASQLNSPLIFLLLVAAVVSALTGELADAASLPVRGPALARPQKRLLPMVLGASDPVDECPSS